MSLETLCREIIEAGKIAIKTPYIHNYPDLETETNSFGSLECSEYTAAYIVTAANNADKLARACLVMHRELFYEAVNVLECVRTDIKTKRTKEDDTVGMINNFISHLRDQVAEVEKIMGEK